MRGRDPSPDFGVKRTAHYEEAFGRPRPTKPVTKQQSIANFDSNAGRSWNRDKGRLVPDALEVEVEKQVDIDVEGEKQWLGLGDNYGYGLGYIRREKSEGLEEQIERELERRGYGSRMPFHNPYVNSQFSIASLVLQMSQEVDISFHQAMPMQVQGISDQHLGGEASTIAFPKLATSQRSSS